VGKKVSGIKLHFAVDPQGFPCAIALTTADVTDSTVALVAFSKPLRQRVGSDEHAGW